VTPGFYAPGHRPKTRSGQRRSTDKPIWHQNAGNVRGFWRGKAAKGGPVTIYRGKDVVRIAE
jgi:hypothetical protein